jgi:hypothetical protein
MWQKVISFWPGLTIPLSMQLLGKRVINRTIGDIIWHGL